MIIKEVYLHTAGKNLRGIFNKDVGEVVAYSYTDLREEYGTDLVVFMRGRGMANFDGESWVWPWDLTEFSMALIHKLSQKMQLCPN